MQRVLEYCTEEQKSLGIMQEILSSACALAQDQYGNYVVQVCTVMLHAVSTVMPCAGQACHYM